MKKIKSPERSFFPTLLQLCFILLFLLLPTKVFAKEIAHKITDPIPPRPVAFRNEGFFLKEYQIEYNEGEMLLSSNESGTGSTLVDDAIRFEISKPSGERNFLYLPHNTNCGPLTPLPPKDMTYLFGKGINTVKVLMRDTCGGYVSSSAIYLVNKNITPDHPQGFLRLPWDYEKYNLSFNEAAMNMSSYFDHEYPMLSRNSLIDLDITSSMVIFSDSKRIIEEYSSHDGYDYAKKSKALIGGAVFAAYDGIATYLPGCDACGQAIVIDHGNGYQTRYYHMEKGTLITSNPEEKVNVTKGEEIGKIGWSGHVLPKSIEGAHLHFMVVQDKNNDGNFEDNIPDGLVDPYGWQSTEPDPWEKFSFFYNNLKRTGNKSFYLWEKQLDNLDMTLTSNGGQFKTERFELNFPQNFTSENLKLKMIAQPSVQTENNLRSIGSTIKTTLQKASGELVSQFPAIYELLIDYRNRRDDILTIDPLTLSIYSSNDGITWVKEVTLLDPENFKAKASLNHMTYFALMAERIDTIAPTTVAQIDGEKGKENWYRSDVTVRLQSTDNQNGLGVAYTLYRLNTDQDWQRYMAPLTFTDEGNHIIEFYSVDNDENIESIKSIEVNIDKTTPEAEIFVDQESLNLKLIGIDNNPIEVTKSELYEKNQYQYLIVDNAGNKLLLTVKFKDKDKKDDFQIEEISYNNSQLITLDKNGFKFSYKKKTDQMKIEKQSFDSEDKKKKTEVILEYDFEKDQTKIEEVIVGKKVKSTQSGFKLLKVKTKGGTLEYSY